MALRDQETAAAVQDIEVRQMELDAQRQLFEQVGPCKNFFAHVCNVDVLGVSNPSPVWLSSCRVKLQPAPTHLTRSVM